MQPQPALLSIDRLSIERGDSHLLRDITWQISPGQHWVILGANGSGKTALLSALSGYLPPTRGRIFFEGQEFGHCDWQVARRRMALVSSAVSQRIEDSALPLETVAAGRRWILNPWAPPAKADRTSALKALRKMGMAHLAERPWLFLSQGERQRVLIARALVVEPSLLILDEPCSGLDPVAREKFLTTIDRLATRTPSPSVVLVTHHVEEITPLYTHVLQLRQGRCVAAGPITESLTEPNLTRTFGASVRLHRADGRLRLELP